MNIPFRIYDFTSVLFPGILALGFIYLETPFNSYPLKEDAIHLAFYFVVAYITGMILQQFSRILFKAINLLSIWKLFSKWFRNLFQKQARDYQNENNEAIRGRHGDYCFSDKLQVKIQEAFYDLYALDLNEIDREEAFALIYSQNDMSQREVFVATGNMKRALAVLTEFIVIFYFVKYFFCYDVICLIKVVVSIGIHLLIASGVYYFKELSDKIPYLAFYKKYCEQNYKKKTATKKKARTTSY